MLLTLAYGALILVGSYLLGSIPFAVVVSRLFGLADPRSFGSGNPGATNVLRSGNKVAAFLTLLGDAAKGAMAVLICRHLVPSLGLSVALVAWSGALAFAGHLYPVFLGFKGGKGVATFLGTVLALSPLVGGFTLLLWLGVAAWTRYSSLASMVCAVSVPMAVIGNPSAPGVRGAAVVMGLFVLWRHRGNMRNIMSGTESKIGQKAKAGQPDSAANP